MILYTVGHSNYPADKFFGLLSTHQVELLVDVRTTPYSRFNPQFNKSTLQQALSQGGIAYTYLGDKLGGRPGDPTCYIHQAVPAKGSDYLNELNYAEVMQRQWFIDGIGQLLELANQQTTAILCSEADSARCHRHHLIARYLMSEHPDVTILHIRGDGSTVDARSVPLVPGQPGSQQMTF